MELRWRTSWPGWFMAVFGSAPSNRSDAVWSKSISRSQSRLRWQLLPRCNPPHGSLLPPTSWRVTEALCPETHLSRVRSVSRNGNAHSDVLSVTAWPKGAAARHRKNWGNVRALFFRTDTRDDHARFYHSA